jgi:5-methylcytosine-specific restriction endonuclease McrA
MMRTLILLSLFLILAGCHNKTPEQKQTTESRKPAKVAPPPKAAVEAGSLPDSNLTPGATLDVTKDDICTPGYSKKVRDVPTSVKKQVYQKYNIPYTPSQYEVDHLISLQLGGSNNVRNLWPESYNIYWNAHVKDALENRLHAMVCNGTISMQEAQKEISTNWIDAYKKYFHTEMPLVGQNRRERNRSDRKAFR